MACDLIVVGSSFSGLACAQSAAKAGLKVTVVDKKSSADSATQSTGIFVKEIADSINLPERLTRKIKGIRLYSPNLKSIDLQSPHYHFVATSTLEVLAWMQQQATKAGANFRFNSCVRTVEQDQHQVTIPNLNLSSRYLVGADGSRSTIAKQFNLGKNSAYLVGIEQEVVWNSAIDRNFMHVFLDPLLAPGYIGWVVPGVNTLQVGLATRYTTKPELQKFIAKLETHFGFTMKQQCLRGGLIPCGGVVSPLAKGRVCLLGDAAGIVSPLTAGGIHPAIDIGQALGDAVADYLLYQGELPHQQIRAHIPHYRVKLNLRRLFDTFTPPTFVYNHVIGNPFFKRLAQIIFFHHRGLLSKQAWKDLLTGHYPSPD